jgi:hypothetical protein
VVVTDTCLERVAAATSAIEGALDTLGTTQLEELSAATLTTFVRSLARIESRLAGITARAVAAADQVGAVDESGATSATTWLADTTGSTTHSAAGAVRLARALRESPTVAARLGEGELSADKARALARAIDRGVLDGNAVEALADDAHDLPAGVFSRLVRAREAAVDHDRLRRDEQWARERRSVTSRRLDDGSLEGTFRLDPLAGDTVETALRALATPDASGTPPEARRTMAQRRADALEALARHALDRGIGGDELNVRPHVSVVVPVEALSPRLDEAVDAGAGGTSDQGTLLSAQSVRSILCDAAVRRVVVSPTGQPLDVGRSTREWSGAQRAASAAVDGGCRGPRCDRPFTWTQLHHVDWWSRGGRTDLARGLPLCTHCHRLVHDQGWTIDLDATTRHVTWRSPDGHTVTTRPRGPAADRHTVSPTPTGRGDPTTAPKGSADAAPAQRTWVAFDPEEPPVRARSDLPDATDATPTVHAMALAFDPP